MFSKEARYYNLFHKNKDYRKEAIELLKQYPKAKTILEIGAGSGLMTRELQKLKRKVVCIEPSKDMLNYWVAKPTTIIQSNIENIPINTFKRNQFDLVIGLYDVLNYVKPKNYIKTLIKMQTWGKRVHYEMWDTTKVKFFTCRKQKNLKRIRLGITFRGVIHLLYIYIGKSITFEKHTLYFHDPINVKFTK